MPAVDRYRYDGEIQDLRGVRQETRGELSPRVLRREAESFGQIRPREARVVTPEEGADRPVRPESPLLGIRRLQRSQQDILGSPDLLEGEAGQIDPHALLPVTISKNTANAVL